MINTAVILAAGKGTRMRELGLNQPKHVISVKGRPFLFYLFDNLAAVGFKKLIVVVGYQKEIMMERLKVWSRLPVEVVVQSEWVPVDQYGTACPIKAVEHLLSEQSFVAVNGDNLYSIKDLTAFHNLQNENAIAGLWHEHPEAYGVLVAESNNILDKVVEKPSRFVGNLINTGLYAFTQEIFQILPQVKLSVRGEYEITDAINLLASKDKVRIIKLTDYWLDFTKPEDIKIVEKFITDGKL